MENLYVLRDRETGGDGAVRMVRFSAAALAS
jgi:hypothetical protein